MKNRVIADRLLPGDTVGSGVSRSEGLHLTDIIRHLGQAIGKIPIYDDNEEPPWEKFECGFCWEEALSASRRGRCELYDCYRPEEYVLDGIAGSPDGLAVYNDQIVLLEHKMTGKSLNTINNKGLEASSWYWLTQIKSYLKMTQLDTAILDVMFVYGDYSRPWNPQYRAYLLEFEQEEIDNNWTMLVKHAKEVMEIL